MESLAPSKAARVKSFSCTNCGGAIEIHAPGFSVSAVCASCGSIIDINHPDLLIIQRVELRAKEVDPLIPLNSRGNLKGIHWEVIGVVVRCERTGFYSWTEYLLYSPYEGFAWLVENEGHWNFVRMIKERPKAGSGSSAKMVTEATSLRTVNFENRVYKLFNKGEIRVRHVLGEFYWRISVDQKSQSADFVSPPFMLSYEGNREETVWSKAEYLEPSELTKAFPKLRLFKFRQGVGANQPSWASQNAGKIWRSFIVFAALAAGLQFLHLARFTRTPMGNFSFTFNETEPGPQRSPSFQLPSGMKNLELTLSAPVRNTWFDADIKLINEATGREEEDLSIGVEFYDGRDGGEYWSEGSQQNSVVSSDIRPGNYHLMIQPAVPKFNSAYVNRYSTIPFQIALAQNSPNFSAFVWTIVLLGLLPLFMLVVSSNIETKRWSNSDYSP